MRSFNRITAAASGVAALLTIVAVNVHAQTQSQSGSMFKDAPSIADQGTGLNPSGKMRERQALTVDRRPDGSTVISGPVHGGKGPQTNITIPQLKFNVRLDGPAGVDENGHPITWKKKMDRQMAHGIVYQGLKARGYNYEEARKKFEAEGRKTQVDMWREKTEETRKYIEKNGPITTKEFVIPGTTPELSAKLNSKDVGVRMENGRRVYYLNGERIDLADVRKQVEAQRQARLAAMRGETGPSTTQETRITRSKRIQVTGEETDKKTADAQNAKTTEKGKAEELKGADRIERMQPAPETAPTKAYEPHPEDDIRRNPLNTVIDPAKLPGVDDVQRQLQEAFPDMNPMGGGKPVSYHENNRFDRAGSLAVLEDVLSFALGISTANAAEPASEAEEPLIPDYRDRLDKKMSDIINDIARRTDKIRKSLNPNKDEEADKKAAKEGETETAQANVQADSESEEVPTYLDTMVEDGRYFDPAAFAAEVVNSTNSLTPEQFEEDAKVVTDVFNKADSPANAVNVLSDLLDAAPEIVNAVPNARELLAARKGELIEIAPPDPLGEYTYIFVSYSLSDAVIKDMMEKNKDRKDVTFVMRGVPDGSNIPDGIQRIQKLALSVTPNASVIIDPTLFKEYGIKTVPAVVRAMRPQSPLTITPDGNRARKIAPMVGKVAGLGNDMWLKEKIVEGERGDLGVQGETYQIAEPDLIEEMKKRVTLVDWQAKKREAVKRFWKNQKYKVFPTAMDDRVRYIDPTILVEKDIYDLAGRKIRAAGDRVNPMQIRPFTQTVLVFNPLSEREMERVKTFQREFREQGRMGLVLIATQIDKKKSWDGYQALTDELDQHVFVITPEIEYQFHIEKTPTVVTGDNNRHVFVVRELGPLEGEAGAEEVASEKP